MLCLESLEDPDKTLRGQRGVDLDVQGFAIEIIDDVECAVFPAVVERIGHEIDRPDRVWHARDIQCDSFTFG